jgi:O-antigen/teichoic acid export membrane protein
MSLSMKDGPASKGHTSTARRLIGGATWYYSAQLLTILMQIRYASITSRVVEVGDFGSYGIALSVAGFFTLLANGGLSQAVARMKTLERTELAAVVGYAIFLGCLAAVLVFFSASFWATLWADENAVDLIRLLSVSALISPLLSVSTGIMRRLSSFRLLSIFTVLANALGMAVGLICVVLLKNSLSLLISAIAAQIILLVLALTANRHLIMLGWPDRKNEQFSFSWRVIVTSMLQYAVGNVVRVTVSRTLGAVAIGHWNRADVLSTLPFQQIQTAMIQVIYPEFRHDREGPKRAYTMWPDLLAVVAWVTVPAGVAGAVLLPHLLPVVLGPGWMTAAALTAPLALAGGIQPSSILLASAIEAIGHFRCIWVVNCLLLISQVGLAGYVIRSGSLYVALYGLLIVNALTQICYIFYATRIGYLSPLRLCRHYGRIVFCCLIMVLLLKGGLNTFAQSSHSVPLYIADAVAVIGILVGFSIWWRKLPPVVLLNDLRATRAANDLSESPRAGV